MMRGLELDDRLAVHGLTVKEAANRLSLTQVALRRLINEDVDDPVLERRIDTEIPDVEGAAVPRGDGFKWVTS